MPESVSTSGKWGRNWAALGKYPFVFPGIIFIASLLTTAGVGRVVHENIQSAARHQFETQSGRIRNEISRRFEVIHSALKAGKGVYAASENVTRANFRAYVKSRNLESESSGMRGFGFVQRVSRSDLTDFLAEERKDDASEFAIHTEGNAPDLFVVKYIEPLTGNEAAWGYDIGSNPIRREAIERAIETGQMVLSQRTALVQDEKKSPGFLLVLPIYIHDLIPATKAERVAAFRGALYAPIVVSEIMQGVTITESEGLDFEIFDGEGASRENLVYDDDHHLSNSAGVNSVRTGRLFEASGKVQIGGRTLTISTSTKSTFDSSINYSSVWLVAIGGTLLGAFLSAIVWLLIIGRGRAIALAHAMTSDLSAANRRAELSLRENAALLQAMNSHSLVSVTDTRGIILDANEAFCTRSGYTREELIGQNHRIVKSNHHAEDFWQQMWKTICQGQIWRGLACNKNKEGVLYWVETTIVPFLNNTGEIEKFISIHNDVTVQIEQRAMLAQATERMELAIAGTSDGLWDWICGSADVWYSNRFWTLLDFKDPADFPPPLFQSFEERLHHDDRQRTNDAIQRHLLFGEVYDVEYRLRLTSGAYHWFRARGDSTRDVNGRSIRMAGSLQDIDARKRVQLQLKESEEFLARVEKIAGVGGWQLDLRTMQPDWTAQTCRIHEVSVDHKSEIVDAINFYVPEARPIIKKALDDCIQNGTPWDMELAFVTRTGKTIWVRTMGERESENGKPTRLVGTLQDITDRKTARDELSRINRDLNAQTILAKEMAAKAQKAAEAKSDFLATMSHEIRTPMNGVIGMTDLLCNTKLSAEQADYVNAIRMSGSSLLTVINDILDFSKIEAGKIGIEHQNIDLWKIIEGAMDIVAIQAREKMLDLSVVIEANVPNKCMGDATRLRQVMLNLLSNAVKFTHAGHVRLKVSVDSENLAEQCVRFSVIDSGIGIKSEDYKRLFSPFTQADDSISRRFGGTGLGLVISRRLSELMGGSIGVESVVGKGSTFWFNCRLGRVKPVLAESAIRLNGLRILVADKSATLRDDLSTQFANWGATVAVSGSAEQTKKEIQHQVDAALPFDVVLLDLRIGGSELIQWIRLACDEHLIRVVAIDTNSESDSPKLDSNVRADLRLVKPIKYTVLSQYLAQVESRTCPDTPIVDAECLSTILSCFPGTYSEQLKQVYETIFKDADPLVTRCLEAIEQQDALAIERSAHAIKGIAGELGAAMLYEHAINIMEFGRRNQLDNAAQEGSALKAELERVRAYLKGLMARSSVARNTDRQRTNTVQTSNPILVVDDIGMNRKVLKTILVKAGFTVEESSSGGDALNLLEQKTYAAIFMDIMMPDIDGLETVRRLRAGGGPNAHGFVIGVSASILEEDRVRCFESGMNDFIAKPIDGPQLLAALDKLLRKSQRQNLKSHR